MVKNKDFKAKQDRNKAKSVIKLNYKEVLLSTSLLINTLNNNLKSK